MDKQAKKRDYKRMIRAQVRLYLQDYKSARPCSCGESRQECLQFHHNDPSTKLFGLSDCRDRSYKLVIAEIAKCRVICANCHLALHFGDEQISRERCAVETGDEEQMLLFE